ncbi:hypothetical protein AVEN_90616-1 [Araneus ventricosus]|uniref:F-box domain-containing protein n=1 Tax=Araneus ventricosus TaxID=182803 RepID=A0A4Y2N045_ARAVE|nr:hypothetical protein AVEN_90616-1 [Araneus ventricosus]
MSLVCRNWSEGYGSPSVWKTFRFALTESQLSRKTCPVMKFVRKYSSMFRHVEIKYLHTFKQSLINTWCQHFTEFLILTNNSQLLSVSFLDLQGCFTHTDPQTYDDICRAIQNFLASQHHLRRVEFHRCLFRSQECVELMKVLIENNRESLTHLAIRKFLRRKSRDEEQDSIVAQSQFTFMDLPSLKTLETDYSLIFENMFARQLDAIKTYENFQTRVFSKIILYYNSGTTKMEDLRGLTSTDWRLLKELFPDLQIEFTFRSDSPSRQELEFLIVTNMPITRLNYVYYDSISQLLHPSLIEIDVLFDHLLACNINDNLVYLHLGWKLPIPDLASTFNPFLLACNKIEHLQLCIVYAANGIDVLLESWLEIRPESLKKVIINIFGINDGDVDSLLKNVIAEHVSRLELVGLNVKVIFHL